jgi:hypothetical protein
MNAQFTVFVSFHENNSILQIRFFVAFPANASIQQRAEKSNQLLLYALKVLFHLHNDKLIQLVEEKCLTPL